MRITCPSCTASLVIQDEFAGRAVKCPQCGGVIPAPQPPPLPSPNEPPPPLPNPNEPPPLPPPPASDRPTARPTSRREEDDEDADRPRRRRRRRDDDDDVDADRPRPRRRTAVPHQKSNTGLILLIVFGFMLLLCGGVGLGIYFAVMKVKDTIDESIDRMRNPATPEKFHAIGYTMTRSQVEAELGTLQRTTATMDDLKAVFPNDSTSMQKWTPKVQQGRVLVWKNAKTQDRLFIAFYPNLNNTSRVQMIELAGKTSGNSNTDAYLYEDDAAYAKQFGLAPATNEPVLVAAIDLIREYSQNSTAADRKYKDKPIKLRNGVLEMWDGNTAVVNSSFVKPGVGKPGAVRIHVEFQPSEKARFQNYASGDEIEFTGTCEGRTGNNVVVKKATFD